jgi:hypothetical protein
MKYLTIFTLGMILTLGSSAFANTKCVVQISAGGPTISVEFKAAGLATISMYVHSRNTYQATYKHNPQTYSEYAKIEDQSTWKDMPEHLLISWHVRKDAPDNFFTIRGLPFFDHLEFSEVYDCAKI